MFIQFYFRKQETCFLAGSCLVVPRKTGPGEQDISPVLPTPSLRFSADHLAWGSEVWSEWLQKVQHSPQTSKQVTVIWTSVGILTIFFKKCFLLHVNVQPAFVCSYALLVAHGDQERALDFSGTVISHHVSAGNQTMVLCKNSKCSLFSSPY